MGDIVNLAARLMQNAEPGTVLCDQVTYTECSRVTEFEDLGASSWFFRIRLLLLLLLLFLLLLLLRGRGCLFVCFELRKEGKLSALSLCLLPC